jgi:hypothetical protein
MPSRLTIAPATIFRIASLPLHAAPATGALSSRRTSAPEIDKEADISSRAMVVLAYA